MADEINPVYLQGLAQLETRNGAKTAGANNLYNIKDFSGKGTRAFDKAEGSNDAYRDYASPEESTADLVSLLTRKYPAALTAKSPQEFAQALKDGGYATDPNYVQKLTNVIQGGKFDPAAAKSTALPQLSAGTISSAGEWDTPMTRRMAGGRQHRPAATDSDGNPIDYLSAIEKTGVIRAGLAGGADGFVAARSDVDAASELGQQAGGLRLPQGPDASFVQAQAVEAAQTADQTKKDQVSFRDQIGAASLQSGFVGAMVRRFAFDDDGPAVPGFTIDEKQYPHIMDGKTEEERNDIAAATNDRMLNRILFEQDERHQREQTISAHGGWQGFAAGALASLGDPLNVVAPFALAKVASAVKLGSAALAAEGRGFAAGAAAFGENAVANVAIEQTNAAIVGEHRTPGDLIAASAMALLPGVLHGYNGWSTGHRMAVATAHADAVRSAVERDLQYLEQAKKNLAPDATPDQLRAEMDRLQTVDMQTTVQGNLTSALPERRQFMPDPDEQARIRELSDKASEVDENGKPTPAAIEASNELGLAGGTKLTDPMSVRHADESPNFWTDRDDAREAVLYEKYRTDDVGRKLVAEHMEGVPNLGWVDKQPVGVHYLPEFESLANGRFKAVADAADVLAQRFLPEGKVVLSALRDPGGASGSVLSVGKRTHLIGISPVQSPEAAIRTLTHEIAHAVFHDNARHIPPSLLDKLIREHATFTATLRRGEQEKAKHLRFAEGSPNVINPETGELTTGKLPNSNYATSFDEWLAEAGTRFTQRDARGANTIGLTSNVISILKGAWEKVKEFYEFARGRGLLPKDEASDEFFKRVLEGTLKDADQVKTLAPEYLDAGLTLPSLSTNALQPVNRGIERLPERTGGQKADKKMMAALWAKADEWSKTNPMDAAWEARAKSLTDNSLFNVASTGLLMLKSKNPIVRMFAAETLEDAAGVVGHRQSTAAISKYMHERMFLGNAVNDVQSAYAVWARDMGAGGIKGAVNDLLEGNNWREFNRRVAEEIENRGQSGRATGGSNVHPSVLAAANSLEAAYERVRSAQVRNKTLGWASLPETSRGYMPHRMSPKKLRELTQEQKDVLHTSLVDQMVGIEGWDISFSANVASQYMQRIEARALGGHDAPMNVRQVGASDVIEEALTQMGLTRQEVLDQMAKFNAAGPGYTKRRIRLDLNQEHKLQDGTSFRLMELFDTDQLHLLRQQAGRASGEVALARHGIFGKPGLDQLRQAMALGADHEKATAPELEAFDQVSAEFLSAPFGNEGGKWMDRARTLNSVARLGGIVFNQFAEYINGVVHVGVGNTLGAIGSIGRLRGEILAKAKGEKVHNSLLDSLETFGGAEFGTEAYKIQFPFDAHDTNLPTYGHDTITATDRILRGAGHIQSKISFWRAIHSAQQRGFAEQIVAKAVRYIKEGGNDIALDQMGIDAGLRGRLAADIDHMATFGPDGKVHSFDITKARDVAAAEDFTQAIHRGVSQIIQGTFIGEQGKWAHSGWLKLLTQFRSFSITSVEKQWARQRNSRGTAQALGILVGSMSIAVPIYMARVYASSIGRADQQAYLEKQLAPFQLTRATMNYVALSGLAPDFLDALTAIAPNSVQEALGTPTGGRAGASKSAVGNIIAPAAGYIDDVWGYAQNLDSPEKAAKVLPFSNVPYLIPAINALSGR